MTTIKKNDFINQFTSTSTEGAIDVDALKNAGIDPKDVAKIDINKDGKIQGKKELGKLFKAVDKFDVDGSGGTIETSVNMRFLTLQTPSGKVFDALKSEMDRRATGAHLQGVIHLGMRKESVSEADALEKANPKSDGGVVPIKAYESKGKVKYDEKDFDLTSEAGLNAYRDALISGPDKMPKDQAQKFVDTLKDIKNESRDEIAQLGLNFYRTGEGKLPVNRLVLSGHGLGVQIQGDDEGEFYIKDVEKLAQVFPKGAEKIEHVAVAACFCAGEETFATLRSAFPNLKSAFAYNEWSPKAEGNAPEHLKKWESMTDGDDPSKVDPPFRKTATWNSVDGTQGLPKISLAETEKNAKDMEFAYEAYASGKKDSKLGTNDRELNEYYARLMDLLRHPDISADRKAEVKARQQEVFKLRHPELVE